MSSKRIAILAPSPPRATLGGIERVVINIANGLAGRGHEVDFLTSHTRSNMWDTLSSNVRKRVVGPNRHTCLFGLLDYARNKNPHVLMSSTHSGNLAALVTKRFLPDLRLVTRHDNHLSSEIARVSKFRRLGISMMRKRLHHADVAVAVSEGVAKDLRALVPDAKNVQTIYNPLDLDGIRSQGNEPVSHLWLLDHKSPVIVAAARLAPVKDLQTLLRAFEVVMHGRRACLIILGDGPELHNLMDLADDLGIHAYVDFAGFQSNPFPYMAKADVFVLSSIHEGAPMVLAEAMALGTPVVSTNCPSGPAEILDNGRLGRLTPPRAVLELALAILDTLGNPPIATPEQLRDSAGRFALDRILDQYEGVLGLK